MATGSETPPQLRPLDIEYRLLLQCFPGEAPRDCTNHKNRVTIATDTESELNKYIIKHRPDLPLPACRIRFSWGKYVCEMTGAYDEIEEDTLISAIPIREKTEKDPADRRISVLGITLIKECTQDETLMSNGAPYIQLVVQFDGAPARPATIWGKEVSYEPHPGAVQFSSEEKFRLGIETHYMWGQDLYELQIRFPP